MTKLATNISQAPVIIFGRNNLTQAHWEGGGQPGWRPGAHEFKQVENCFLNHNSSIPFCCTDSSLLMTHRGGLSLSIIIWRIGGEGPSFLLPWVPTILLAALFGSFRAPVPVKHMYRPWYYPTPFLNFLLHIYFR
jgi:hypothetical protein